MEPMEQLVGPNQRHLMEASTAGAPVEMILALLRVARRVDAQRSANLRPIGLSEGRLGALLAIHRNPGTSPAALADVLQVTRATVTGLLDGLERDGNIERRPDANDRRAQALHPTAAGEETMQEGITLVSSFLGGLTDGLDEADVDAALRVLHTLWGALSAERVAD